MDCRHFPQRIDGGDDEPVGGPDEKKRKDRAL